ncbi:MAG: Na(+)/H(+) antiporter subunit D [Desulfovermiculus sp.]|nr:Na(+)/H(+) antiporter subunit D [Desulfovermiculus sp.]
MTPTLTANLFHPGIVLILGALVLPFLQERAKGVYLLALPLAAGAALLTLSPGLSSSLQFWGYDLYFCRVDKLSLLFGYVFGLMALLGALFALQVKDDVQHVAALVYAGSTLGVVFAGDLLTLYIFWELMAVSSTFLILAARNRQAQQAGFRYVLMHIVGGLLLLAGIILYAQQTGSLEFAHIGLNGTASWLIFLGFALNAAAMPLHAWLPDAYPQGTPTSAVFLSAFTTKSAVYLMARSFAGTELLIWVGAVMVVVPILYALLENDIRRVLAYSLLNQTGFMFCGIGIGTPLALNGAVAHAFCCVLYMALLFMAAGAVLQRTGKNEVSHLGGLYRSMPWTCLMCIVGAASIAAMPLFSGFVSKSMVLSASGYEHMPVLWLLLQLASAGAVYHAGVKVPYFTFFGSDSGLRPKEASWNMLLAMALTAVLCLFIGVYPAWLYALLPYPVDYVPYTAVHVLEQLQILAFGTLAFALVLGRGYYPLHTPGMTLDVDWVYRRGGDKVYTFLDWSLNGINAGAERLLRALAGGLGTGVNRLPTALLMFFSVNLWLLMGYTGRHLEVKKRMLAHDMRIGTVPVGLGAAIATLFIFIVYIFM